MKKLVFYTRDSRAVYGYVPDDIDVQIIANSKFFGLETKKGIRYVNIENVLWFELLNVTQKEEEEEKE